MNILVIQALVFSLIALMLTAMTTWMSLEIIRLEDLRIRKKIFPLFCLWLGAVIMSIPIYSIVKDAIKFYPSQMGTVEHVTKSLNACIYDPESLVKSKLESNITTTLEKGPGYRHYTIRIR